VLPLLVKNLLWGRRVRCTAVLSWFPWIATDKKSKVREQKDSRMRTSQHMRKECGDGFHRAHCLLRGAFMKCRQFAALFQGALREGRERGL
jgi:hypothetical protein